MVSPRWPMQVWWPKLISQLIALPIVAAAKEKDNANSSKQSRSNRPSSASSGTHNVSLIRQSLENQGLSEAASNIITQSRRQDVVNFVVNCIRCSKFSLLSVWIWSRLQCYKYCAKCSIVYCNTTTKC